MLIARGMRCTVSVYSTSCLNPSFSSMVATGNKPRYGVRFLPEKSKEVLAAILLGSDATFGEPCGTGVLRVCLELSFTIWVTPGSGLAKAITSRPFCSTTAFSGSPNGFSFHTLRRTHQNSCIDQVTQLCSPSLEFFARNRSEDFYEDAGEGDSTPSPSPDLIPG